MTDHWVNLDDFGEVVDISHLHNGAAPPDEDSWRPINLNGLPDTPPVEPTLGKVGDIGLVYPGKRHVFSGPQESAKTLAAYAIALQVIRDGHRVLIIDFEMGSYDARNRLRELGATPQDFERILYIEPHEPATTERIQTLVALQPALVIIDAAAGAFDLQGLDDNKRQDVERLAALYIKLFWRNEIATIMLDHVVKNTEARGKYAIGSERKVGGADVHLGFEVIMPIRRGSSGLYKITTHKDRGGYLQRGKLAELSLTSHQETHRITWEFKAAEKADEETGEFLYTHQMERISRHLEQLTEPVSLQHIKEHVSGRDAVTAKAAEQLARGGYATETEGPRAAKLYKTTHPYRDGNPIPRPMPTSARPLPGIGQPPLPTSAPPYGGRAGVPAAGNSSPMPAHDDDPEVRQMLEHYDLLAHDEDDT